MASEKKSTSIRIDPALWDQLKEAAEIDRRSVSRAVEEAIEAYIRKVQRSKKAAA